MLTWSSWPLRYCRQIRSTKLIVVHISHFEALTTLKESNIESELKTHGEWYGVPEISASKTFSIPTPLPHHTHHIWQIHFALKEFWPKIPFRTFHIQQGLWLVSHLQVWSYRFKLLRQGELISDGVSHRHQLRSVEVRAHVVETCYRTFPVSISNLLDMSWQKKERTYSNQLYKTLELVGLRFCGDFLQKQICRERSQRPAMPLLHLLPVTQQDDSTSCLAGRISIKVQILPSFSTPQALLGKQDDFKCYLITVRHQRFNDLLRTSKGRLMEKVVVWEILKGLGLMLLTKLNQKFLATLWNNLN